MEKIEFLATDGVNLTGVLYKGKEESDKVILAVHGMTSNCFKKRDDIISKKANENGIDYFCFNNRGSEIVKYISKSINGNKEKLLGGTAYEDVIDSYEDIVGAILKLKELGYSKIYLQGHSLGCTKIVYTYNELLSEEENDILEVIKGVILLSLVDIPMTLKYYLGDNFDKYISIAEEMVEKNSNTLMPREAFIHPISAKTFLRYSKNNKEIDFAGYGRDNELEKLNNVKVPLFMRWGNDNEMIIQKADELVTIVSNIITNENKDINYIDGADHGYHKKEEVLADEILNFINKNK